VNRALLTDIDVIVLLLTHAPKVLKPILVDILVDILEVVQFFEFAPLICIRKVFLPVIDSIDKFVRGSRPQFELGFRLVDLQVCRILN
jgi:hypothetical protein